MERSTRASQNPLARIAESIPAVPALAVSMLARLVGAGAAIYYAYDQDVLFPGRHFPRTWVFAIVIASVALLSLLPWERIFPRREALAVWAGALGCGILVFGGANLAHKAPGVVVLVAGVVAWLAFAAAAHHKRADAGMLVSGLFVGSLASFLTVAVCVFLIGG